MNTQHLKIAILATAFLLFYIASHAQKNAHATGTVWKKEIGRIVELKETEDPKVHHLRNLRNDTVLLEMIVNAVMAGKITAYSSWDHYFTTKLSPKEMQEMLLSKPDTVTMVDPVTGKEMMKIVNHDFDYGAVTKWRIYEQWSFNRETGHTDIQIVGIAPMLEVYVDGNYRGMKPLFWIRYADITGILARYEEYYPNNFLAGKIWDDYFLSDVKPGAVK
jgi:hypothetical protein